jgi:hypothetical protein
MGKRRSRQQEQVLRGVFEQDPHVEGPVAAKREEQLGP